MVGLPPSVFADCRRFGITSWIGTSVAGQSLRLLHHWELPSLDVQLCVFFTPKPETMAIAGKSQLFNRIYIYISSNGWLIFVHCHIRFRGVSLMVMQQATKFISKEFIQLLMLDIRSIPKLLQRPKFWFSQQLGILLVCVWNSGWHAYTHKQHMGPH